MKHLTYLTTIALLVAACAAGPQGAERIDEQPADPDPYPYEEPASHIEASPDIDGVLDDAVDVVRDYDDYAVLISQDDRHIHVTNYTAQLQPRPFTIWVVAPKETAALINVSYSPQARNAVIRDEPLSEPLGEPGTGIAEHPFNENRELFLDDGMSNYWNYSDDDEYRFDEVEWRDDVFIGKRHIKRVRHLERDETRSISELSGNTLHVVEFKHSPHEPAGPKRSYSLEFE